MDSSENTLITYRTEVMGFATILILVFHSEVFQSYPWIPIADVGVDIFLFLSGMGCYYSFNNYGKAYDFYKKRLIRILPSYLIIFIPFYFYLAVLDGKPLLNSIIYFFYRISTLNFWLKGVIVCWFIPAILMLYFLTPFFVRLIMKCHIKYVTLLMFIVIVDGILTILSFRYIEISSRLIFLNRIPAYLLGIEYAFNKNSWKKKNKVHFETLIIFMVAWIVVSLKINNISIDGKRLFFSITVPIVCYFIAEIISFAHTSHNILKFFGECSLYYYLLYERITLLHISNMYLKFILCILITSILSFVMKKTKEVCFSE